MKTIKLNKKCSTLLTLSLLNVYFNFANAQICTNVKELYRKRHKAANMTYGHPYTMFRQAQQPNLIGTMDLPLMKQKTIGN